MKKFLINFIFLFLGICIGGGLTSFVGLWGYRIVFNKSENPSVDRLVEKVHFTLPEKVLYVEENFKTPIKAQAGKRFGANQQLAFELYRNGTFIIDGQSEYAWQKSDHYGDVALIRSAQSLPKTYKISVVVGDIDYGLKNIEGLPKDPIYHEGPTNENGCYLLVITDEDPSGHHENKWWHEHRKIVIDVDNNVWGIGSPRPIFMVYFNKNNELMSFDDTTQRWVKDWKKAATYEPQAWYRVEIEKTLNEFILTLLDQQNQLINQAKISISEVWNADRPEFFVIGDPHENYYQGSMKVKSIKMPVSL